MKTSAPPHGHIDKDIILIGVSIIISAGLVRTGGFAYLLTATDGIAVIQTFVAGIFFPSAFTTALAIPVFTGASRLGSPLITPFIGACGAMIGDVLLFGFVKGRITEDILLITKKKGFAKIKHIFDMHLFHQFSVFVAALLMASPLPDDVGIALLGIENMRTPVFLLISFLSNFVGILVISYIALHL